MADTVSRHGEIRRRSGDRRNVERDRSQIGQQQGLRGAGHADGLVTEVDRLRRRVQHRHAGRSHAADIGGDVADIGAGQNGLQEIHLRDQIHRVLEDLGLVRGQVRLRLPRVRAMAARAPGVVDQLAVIDISILRITLNAPCKAEPRRPPRATERVYAMMTWT